MLPINIPIWATDQKILEFFNQFHTPLLDKIVTAISNIGEYAIIWIVAGIILAFLDRKNGKKFFIILTIALVLELIINDGLIKHIFFRERPYLALSNIHHVGVNWSNSSFVSGHTASSFAALVVISKYYRKIIAPSIIVTLIMIYTRFYLGMHYPTDILGGILVGLLAAWLSLRIISNRVK